MDARPPRLRASRESLWVRETDGGRANPPCVGCTRRHRAAAHHGPRPDAWLGNERGLGPHQGRVYGRPRRPVGTQASAGAVAVTQDSPNVPSGDEFGSSLTICDLDQDGRPDLAVGGGGEDGYHGAVRALPDRGSRPAIDRTLCAAGAWAVVVRCPHEAGR
ncbi:FG-GAP repeat protein [Streptomyces sp. 1222.5]|uniref:FG-GAP repeat protein n=1 Tax=Streptomyces sp. 1222.5 TaxID=1881026 RepID=UPI003EBDE520